MRPAGGGGGFGFADFGAEEGGGFGDAYAAGSLYHRIEGDRVDVLLRIEVADDWHLYGEELGHPQAIGLPTFMTLFAFIGVAVTSATVTIFGEAIADPTVLLGKMGSGVAVFDARDPLALERAEA